MLRRRVLRRHLVRISVGTGVLRRAAEKMALRRQKHALSQSTTPFACTLSLSLHLKTNEIIIPKTFSSIPVSATKWKINLTILFFSPSLSLSLSCL